jgi:hypothetical protein
MGPLFKIVSHDPVARRQSWTSAGLADTVDLFIWPMSRLKGLANVAQQRTLFLNNLEFAAFRKIANSTSSDVHSVVSASSYKTLDRLRQFSMTSERSALR